MTDENRSIVQGPAATPHTFEAEGYITGDYECLCIADAKSPRDQDRDSRIYPDRWFEHLDQTKKYKLRITVEAHEIE